MSSERDSADSSPTALASVVSHVSSAREHPIAKRLEQNLQRVRKDYRQLRRNKTATFGLYFVWFVVAVAALAPIVAPYDPTANAVGPNLAPPSVAHPFGTDPFGRDILSRVIFGARVSVMVGFIAVAEALVAGVIIGLVAGYVGGWLDAVLMRIMDAILAFPVLVLAIVLVSILGVGIVNVMLAVGLRYIPTFARVTRGEVLSVKEQDFVRSSKLVGSSRPRILVSEILPNIVSPIIVTSTVLVAYAILAEAGLSFLGLGVQPPTASWGMMLSRGQTYIRIAPWLALFPGIALVMTVLSINLLGDGLRDIFDPEMRGET